MIEGIATASTAQEQVVANHTNAPVSKEPIQEAAAGKVNQMEAPRSQADESKMGEDQAHQEQEQPQQAPRNEGTIIDVIS